MIRNISSKKGETMTIGFDELKPKDSGLADKICVVPSDVFFYIKDQLKAAYISYHAVPAQSINKGKPIDWQTAHTLANKYYTHENHAILRVIRTGVDTDLIMHRIASWLDNDMAKDPDFLDYNPQGRLTDRAALDARHASYNPKRLALMEQGKAFTQMDVTRLFEQPFDTVDV